MPVNPDNPRKKFKKSADLRVYAEKLAAASERLGAMADGMDAAGIRSLKLDGMGGLGTAVALIEEWIGKNEGKAKPLTTPK